MNNKTAPDICTVNRADVRDRCSSQNSRSLYFIYNQPSLFYNQSAQLIRIEITTKTVRIKGYIRKGISETLATPAILAATRSWAP